MPGSSSPIGSINPHPVSFLGKHPPLRFRHAVEHLQFKPGPVQSLLLGHHHGVNQGTKIVAGKSGSYQVVMLEQLDGQVFIIGIGKPLAGEDGTGKTVRLACTTS